jgi:hypothetical protein
MANVMTTEKLCLSRLHLLFKFITLFTRLLPSSFALTITEKFNNHTSFVLKKKRISSFLFLLFFQQKLKEIQVATFRLVINLILDFLSRYKLPKRRRTPRDRQRRPQLVASIQGRRGGPITSGTDSQSSIPAPVSISVV